MLHAARQDPKIMRDSLRRAMLDFLAAECAAAPVLRGQTQDAERLYLQALQLKQELLGPHHPDVAMTLNNLAALYADGARIQEAAQLYQQALGIFARTLPNGHPKLVQCRKNYQRLHGRE